ncbi:hypothetical protein DFH09DRAFT_1314577 [Mycena vulgaris]|nr:hypothetical protein DFH09DRAFT_1314577 [Mycena vulgaris]
MTASLQTVLERATFDFVIVGGGTCGHALAPRLTESPEPPVLVLEADAANLDPKILTPGLFGIHITDLQYN